MINSLSTKVTDAESEITDIKGKMDSIEQKTLLMPDLHDKQLNDCTWQEIHYVCQNGLVNEMCWEIGDRKVIWFNRCEGNSLNCVASLVDKGDNWLRFMIVAIEDASYNSFSVCLGTYNADRDVYDYRLGWEGSPAKKYLNTKFLELLPDDLQDIIADSIYYTAADSTGSDVQVSTSKLYIPSEYEVTGYTHAGNSDAENSSNQKQFEYFKLYPEEQSNIYTRSVHASSNYYTVVSKTPSYFEGESSYYNPKNDTALQRASGDSVIPKPVFMVK